MQYYQSSSWRKHSFQSCYTHSISLQEKAMICTVGKGTQFKTIILMQIWKKFFIQNEYHIMQQNTTRSGTECKWKSYISWIQSTKTAKQIQHAIEKGTEYDTKLQNTLLIPLYSSLHCNILILWHRFIKEMESIGKYRILLKNTLQNTLRILQQNTLKTTVQNTLQTSLHNIPQNTLHDTLRE